MRIVNAAIPRRDRAVVQMHLDQLNKILPAPDITQLDVIVGGAGYSLKDAAEDRVEAKLAELVSHQLPSPTGGSLPSVAPSVKSACDFFGVPLDYTPPSVGDVEGQGIDR